MLYDDDNNQDLGSRDGVYRVAHLHQFQHPQPHDLCATAAAKASEARFVKRQLGQHRQRPWGAYLTRAQRERQKGENVDAEKQRGQQEQEKGRNDEEMKGKPPRKGVEGEE